MYPEGTMNLSWLGAGSQLIWLGTSAGVVAGLAAVILGLNDRRLQRRDWLHWLGITLMGLSSVNIILEYPILSCC
jgi:hypothetical protein